MDLRKSLAMFRISGRVPIEELNTSFRDLVKKYHPDKVRDHPEWAHERMAEINDAYETLAEWISSPVLTGKHPGNVDEEERSRPAADDNRENPDFSNDLYRRETPVLSARMEEAFYPVFNGFLDGLGLYYQYGLERESYREEGVRRFRFREALRTVEKTRDELEMLSAGDSHPAIKAAARFARLSVADMVMGEPRFPTGPPTWKKFDRRLMGARRDFDGAVREILFPELIPAHLRGRAAGSLYTCYTEFVLFLTVFTEGERRKAGILQTARYDAFMDLMELRNEGILRF